MNQWTNEFLSQLFLHLTHHVSHYQQLQTRTIGYKILKYVAI